MKKTIPLTAMLAMAVMIVVPILTQVAPADPDIPVSEAPDNARRKNPFDCAALKAIGADVDCDVAPHGEGNDTVGDTPGAKPKYPSECEHFNEQYGTAVECDALADEGVMP